MDMLTRNLVQDGMKLNFASNCGLHHFLKIMQGSALEVTKQVFERSLTEHGLSCYFHLH